MAAGDSSVALSLDLNLSRDRFAIRGNCLVLDNDWAVDINDLASVASSRQKVFALRREGLVPIEVRSDAYNKLVPTDTVPTLEINGIKMHRSKEIDPLVDAREKTRLVVTPNDQVLDTCGGLGYSAVFALKAGAKNVVSTEKSRGVIQIRQQNPWLTATGDDRIGLGNMNLAPIEWVNADVTRYILTLPDQSFDSVIHDPPRFTAATGELYGKAFYTQLFRVMKPSSRLFHYTGSPKKINYQDRFIKNAIRRLEQVGFSQVAFNERLQGIHVLKNFSGYPGVKEPVWKTTFR
jgi:predicted methyltransferase